MTALAVHPNWLRSRADPHSVAEAAALLGFRRRVARAGTVADLSLREMTVLQLVADGFTYEAMAEELSLSLSTVKAYMHTTLIKLGADNTIDAIRRGVALGIVEFP